MLKPLIKAPNRAFKIISPKIEMFVRQAVDDTAALVGYNEYDPYGNAVHPSSFILHPYGFTGEWWEQDVELLHLRSRWYAPYYNFILVIDPNNMQREGLPEPIPLLTDIPGYVNTKDNTTVYNFSGQSQLAMGQQFDEGFGFGFGKLITWYGLYQESPDYTNPSESYKETYEWKSKNVKCDDILKCLRQAYDTVQSMQAYYGLTWRNSNSTAAFGLRKCGLSASTPANNVWAPAFRSDVENPIPTWWLPFPFPIPFSP